MRKKYIVELSVEERGQLETIRDSGEESLYRQKHAQIFLLADQGHGRPAWIDKDIAEAVGVTERTVANARKRFSVQGFTAALEYKKRETPPVAPKLTGDKEARVIALACSPAPEGQVRWTLELLAGKLVELEVFDSISITSVNNVLKKTNFSLTGKNAGASRRSKARDS
jgi:transposase